MKVIVTKNAGFCFGVRRSLDLLNESIESAHKKRKTAVMLGPIIHNPRLIEQYNRQGVGVVTIDKTPEELLLLCAVTGLPVIMNSSF